MNTGYFASKWIVLLAIIVLVSAGAWAGDTSAADNPQAKAAVQQYMAGPSVFIENQGQWPDSDIKFALDGMGANVGITDNGPRFQLFRKSGAAASEASSRAETGLSPISDTAPATASEMHEFGLVFDGAAVVSPTGRGKSDRTFNYLQGDVSTHRDGVGSFDAVWYENLWPGVSLELTGNRTGLKYNFHVAPGTDSKSIRLRYDGIAGLSVRDDGTLEIRIADGWQPLADGKPYIYQERNGEKRAVAGRFTLVDQHTYGFEVTDAYDATLPLVIDPSVAWGTYLGGTGNDRGYGVAVDTSGNCYVTGYTSSSGWVSGGWKTSLNGGSGSTSYTDGFVVKLSSAGAHVWSTYLGGTGDDQGYGIAVDTSGNCYVTGYTNSSGWVSGGWKTSLAGGDGFVVKLSSAGAHVWSTYLGGTGDDQGYGIAVDTSGNCYVTGYTLSSGWVSGGWKTSLAAGYDGYVVKLSSAGAHVWSTYLGGASTDQGYGIAVDTSGNCYATGYTQSSGWVSGGWNTSLNGGSGSTSYYDGFVVKLTSAGAHVWSTYLGGAGDDYGYGVAVDSSGNCYVSGYTASSGWVSGGWNTSLNGGSGSTGYYDGFVMKLSSAGVHVWSSYLGGTGDDYGRGIAEDASGNCYVKGGTYSNGWVSGGYQTTLAGYTDGYVVKLSSAGAHVWSSYLGGTGDDYGYGVAVDTSGNCYATGYTYSSGWVSGGWNTSLNGGSGSTSYTDGFVAKITDTSGTGSLQVTLTPTGAVSAGAQWRPVTSSTWYNSGDTISGIAAGQWVIEFKDAYGWVPPTSHTVAVTSGATVTDTATYTAASVDMSWSTYLGGTGNDYGQGIAVDSSGNCYVTGYTYSSGWVSGGWNTSLNGGSGSMTYSDGFVVKLSSAGAHVWSTYLGGTGNDYGRGIAVDSSGNCYVTGYTYSSGWVSSGWNTSLNGGSGSMTYSDGFVVKLSSAGAHVWSTYLGGTSNDYGYGIAVDTSGNCYVTGYTYSSGWVSGGWDTTINSGSTSYYDGFVVKLSSAGAHVWSSYLGGTSTDYGQGIAVDTSGNCYATGYTYSSGWVSGGYQTTLAGSPDGYVVKLSSAGAHVWSTYLGGTGNDYGYGIAVDTSGNCYATGYTYSSGWVSGGWNTSFNGGSGSTSYPDGFVAKLSSAGAHVWSTYLGGTGNDYGCGIAEDASGNCYVMGYTTSSGWVSGGGDTLLNTGLSSANDAYVVKLSPAGAHVWSTYLGGAGDEYGYGVAVDSSGTNTYVTGYTTSGAWVINGWQTAYGGGTDGFVAKIVDNPLPTAPSNPGTTAIGTNTITWTWTDNSSNETGFKVYDDPGSSAPTTLQATTAADATSWPHTGLTPNTQYAFQVCATNASGDSDKTTTLTKYTLASAPSIGNNVTCDHSVSTPYVGGTTFTFSNPAGFGAGTSGGSAYKATQFKYVWDTNAAYAFTGAEADWSTGTIAQSPTASGSYYLHLESLNAESAANATTLDYGPFVVDADAPIAAAGDSPNVDQSSPVAAYDFTILYIDETAIKVSSLDNADIRVTGPNSYDVLATFLSSDPGTGADLETATYTVAPPGGTWDLADEGVYTISLESGQVTDTAGNAAASGELGGFLVDFATSVTLDSTAAATVNGAIAVTATLSEPSTTFTASNIQCTNAAVADFVGSGTTYTFNLVPNSSGVFTFSCYVPAGAFTDTDGYGKGNLVSNTLSRTCDNVKPGVTLASTAAAYTNHSPIPVTATFTKSVTGFDAPDVVPGNGTVSNFVAVSGTTYTFDLTPLAEGVVTAGIAAGIAQDSLGNTNNAATTLSRTYDITPPTATITRVSAATTSANTLVFRVAFSETVAPTFTADDLTSTGTLWGSVSITGGPTYSISITPANADADGTVSFNVGTAVTDLATNAYAGGTSPVCTVANWHGITTQPASTQQYSGGTTTLTVTPDCSATTDITYQWKADDGASKAIRLGPTTSTWDVALEPANNGTYWCEMTYDGETHESDHVTIRVADALTFTPGVGTNRMYLGGSISMAANASGGFTPLKYQWSKSGSAIDGATNATYEIASVSAGDAAAYSVKVDDDFGSTLTSNGSLATAEHLSLTDNPVGARKYTNENDTFTVGTSGGFTPMHYQWQKDGADLSGATNATLAFAPVALTNAGTYRVVVKDDVTDTQTSSSATLDTAEPLVVTLNDPAIVRVYTAENHPLTATVTGGFAPLTQQWSKDGTDLSGETGTSYAITGASAASIGTYAFRVTDDLPTTKTVSAQVLVADHLQITADPVAAEKTTGDSYTLNVTTSGGFTPLSYQWKRNGVAIANATNSTLAFTSIAAANEGNYACQVSDPGGDVLTSASALLHVAGPLAILQAPQTVRAYTGGGGTFTVETSGGFLPLTYRWEKDGGTIDGATNVSFSVTSASTALEGDYKVTITDAHNTSITSGAGTLEVADHLAITEQPQSGTVNTGLSYTFHVETTGGFTPLSYQWNKDEFPIDDATQATYTVTGAAAGDAGSYTVDIADIGSDSRTSDTATLTVNAGTGLPVMGLGALALLVCSIAIGGNILLVVRNKLRAESSSCNRKL